MVELIFVDLDDVLNTFARHALNHVGCDLALDGYDFFESEWGFDLVLAANKLHPFHEFTEEDFWNSITRDVWATIPISEDALWLLAECESIVGRGNVVICTAPTTDPDCLAGKLEWIHHHLPSYYHRQYVITPRKQYCKNPTHLLIDDSQHNCEAFNEAGGMAILIPRPWNAAWDGDRSLRNTVGEGFKVFRNLR